MTENPFERARKDVERVLNPPKHVEVEICSGCHLQPIIVINMMSHDPHDSVQCGYPWMIGPTRYYCSQECFEEDHPLYRCEHDG